MRKDGYWSGWEDYRYGPKAKVTLPRVLTGERKKHVVTQVMGLMKDWRLSPFENEGAIRHGIRSGMCLNGERWAIADHEAEILVGETFRLMGDTRPSWEQGQRQYAVAEECCHWCGLEIPEEDRAGLRRARFCSAPCAKSAILHRDYEGRRKEDATFRSAASILRRDQSPSQVCLYCEREFKPFNTETKDQRYCSHECSRRALRTIAVCECHTCHKMFRPRTATSLFCSRACATARPIEQRNCACCEKPFMPKSEQAVFCGNACRLKSARIRNAAARGATHKPIGTLLDGTCRHCHQPFMARSPKAVYCGPRCNEAAYKARRKQGPSSNVIPFPVLTVQVFDEWFRRAA